MDNEMRKRLIEIARQNVKDSRTYYQTLSDDLGKGYNMVNENEKMQLAEELGEISKYEHESGRPLLSSLVVRKNDKEQGDGFYKLCVELGFGGDWEVLKRNRNFEREQRNRCYEFWSNKNNYRKYRDE